MINKKILLGLLFAIFNLFPITANISAATWTIETVDNSGWVGRYTSIALDSSDKVHISYNDYSDYTGVNQSLEYATNVSGSWKIKTVDNSKKTGAYTSIAIGSSNKAHISYTGYGIDHLRYAADEGGFWSTEIVDKSTGVGNYTSIALDSSDRVHISYDDYNNNDLKYATNASGSWKTSIVDSLGWVGEHSSIAVDKSDKVHISYQDYTKGDLKYATNASGTWVTTTVYSMGFGYFGMYTSIAVDESGKVHISFHNAYGNLMYATNASGSWVTTTVESGKTDDCGAYTSIALDSSGKVHISYYAEEYEGNNKYNTSLKYATNASGSWVTATIDNSEVASSSSLGTYTSIAVDESGWVHISYHDGTNQTLKYATNADQSTTTTPTPTPTATPIATPTTTTTSTPITGHSAALSVSQSEVSLYDSVVVTVVDWDLNTSSSYADTGRVKIKSNSDTTGFTLGLYETNVNSGTFQSTFMTADTTSYTKPAKIAVVAGDTITVSYVDDLTATGNSATITNTVSVKGTTGTPTPGVTPTPTGVGDIAGVVVSAALATPLAGATVSTDTGGFTATTGADGTYTISNVTPGDYTLTASATGFVSSSQSVTVTAGVTTTANFDLSSATATPTPVVTPTPASTTCELEWWNVNPDVLKLKRKKSGYVDVMLGGGNDCTIQGETIKAMVSSSSSKYISISPVSQETNESGVATFFVTAKRKAGKAMITFEIARTGDTWDVIVNVRK